MRRGHWFSFATLAGCIMALVAVAAQQEQGGQVRTFDVTGDHYTFSPNTLVVNRGDLVKVTFTAKDIAHSFTIDEGYRISKRAGAGQSVTFEFRADATGEHTIYCNLSADPKCKDMKGKLIVH